MMILGVIAFTLLPLLIIVILVKSKRIGIVKKILLSTIIVVVSLLITAVFLGNFENYLNLDMNNNSYDASYLQ